MTNRLEKSEQAYRHVLGSAWTAVTPPSPVQASKGESIPGSLRNQHSCSMALPSSTTFEHGIREWRAIAHRETDRTPRHKAEGNPQDYAAVTVLACESGAVIKVIFQRCNRRVKGQVRQSEVSVSLHAMPLHATPCRAARTKFSSCRLTIASSLRSGASR